MVTAGVFDVEHTIAWFYTCVEKNPKKSKNPPKLKYPGLELLSSGDRRCVHLLVPRSTLNIRVGSASRGSTAVRVTDYVTASQRFFGKGSKRTQRERSEKRRPRQNPFPEKQSL